LALGLAISNLFTGIISGAISPSIHSLLYYFSETGFNYAHFKFGSILEQVIIFVIFIIVLYYGFVLPVDNLKEKYNIEQKTVACPYCMSLINPLATRCPNCTSQINRENEPIPPVSTQTKVKV